MHLDELKRKIKNRIQPYSNIPNPEQLHEAVIVGLDTLSERSPKLKSVIIEIQSGITSYELPSDFQNLSEFDYPGQSGGMIGDKLFASSAARVDIKIIDNNLIISPAPSSNFSVVMYYYAYYTPDENGNYSLTNQQANAVAIKACEIITRMKADKAAEQAWVQQNDKERVDMSKKYDAFARESESYKVAFQDAIATLNSQSIGSPYGVRKSYANNPYDPWSGSILESDSY
jgi:hypothetical protein